MQPNKAGRLIVVEGPDGVGKTTICGRLASILGDDVLSLSFPGQRPGTIGDLVYKVHHDQKRCGLGEISPLAKQALHVAAHVDAIEREILPALRSGKTVVLDRYWWSAWVYGLVSGCDHDKLKALVQAERVAWSGVSPDLAILLRRSSPIGRDDPLAVWKQLSEGYDRLAEYEHSFYPVLALVNHGSLDDAVASIVSALPLRPKVSEDQNQFLIQLFPIEVRAPEVVTSHITPLKPSIAYDTYWRFAAERQAIFLRRLQNLQPPWTDDRILREYKFTNAYRASDRVSQYLIRQVIYDAQLPGTINEVFFRIMLFKFFNKIETWEALQHSVGPITLENYNTESYDRVLTRLREKGQPIYSAAYIMPSAALVSGSKHYNHLLLLERMIANSLPERLRDCGSMQKAFELLKEYQGIGDFLAYQYVTDINYSEITSFTENEFVVPGPGALDGIRKCFVDRGGLNEPETIKFMADRQEQEFDRLGIDFSSLWGRRLQLIDCQNLFCEVDKYSRVRHPEVAGLSGRLRIKQRLSAKQNLPSPWYPPKWGLNEKIAAWERLVLSQASLRALAVGEE